MPSSVGVEFAGDRRLEVTKGCRIRADGLIRGRATLRRYARVMSGPARRPGTLPEREGLTVAPVVLGVRRRGPEVPEELELLYDLPRALLGRLLVGLEDEVGGDGRFVRIRDAGELLDLPGEGLLVEALHVALGGDFERHVHEDLDEVYDPAPDLVARLLVGRDGRDDDRHAVAGEQVGHEPDPQHVYVAVLSGEAEAPGEVGAHDVPVEDLHPQAPLPDILLDDLGDGCLACTRETREPQGETALVLQSVLHTPDPFCLVSVASFETRSLQPGRCAFRPEPPCRRGWASREDPAGASAPAGRRSTVLSSGLPQRL